MKKLLVLLLCVAFWFPVVLNAQTIEPVPTGSQWINVSLNGAKLNTSTKAFMFYVAGQGWKSQVSSSQLKLKLDSIKHVNDSLRNIINTSLSGKQPAGSYRTMTDHDSLSHLQEKLYSSLDGKPDLNVFRLIGDTITGTATPYDLLTGLATKVDKVTGKGLSTEDYSTTEKSKLLGIAAGAEVNVNPDWNASSGDAQILNKPDLSTKADLVAGKVPLSQINDVLLGAVSYQSSYYVITNSPALPNAVGHKGWYYIVADSGFISMVYYKKHDWIVSNGTSWDRIPYNGSVWKVNGYSGDVVLTTDDISEGVSRKYFSQSLARGSVSFAAGSGGYNSSTGVITIPTNLSQLTNGPGYITGYSETDPVFTAWNKSIGISITKSQVSDFPTWSAATSKPTYNTNEVSEVTNLYFTDARARSAQYSANGSTTGLLTSTDWTTFNNKQSTLVSGTNIKSLNGTTLLGSGNIDLSTTYAPISGSGNYVQLQTSSPQSGGFYIAGFGLFGYDTDGTLDTKTGYRVAYTGGNVYLDTKTYTGGVLNFRIGQGTETGSQRNWLSVLASSGAATFSSTINGLTMGIDGTYGSPYYTYSFGSSRANGTNRILAATDGSDGLFLAAATGRGIQFRVNGSEGYALNISSDKAAVFSSTVSATQFNASNLTANYIPKQGTGGLVNSILSSVNTHVTITASIPYLELHDNTGWNNSAYIQAGVDITGSYAGDYLALTVPNNKNIQLGTTGTGSVQVSSTLASTSSTTGAFVVGGGIGVGGNGYFGDGTGSKYLTISGGNSGGTGGSAIGFSNSTTSIGAIGNLSACIGGAYNANLAIYSANNIIIDPVNTSKVFIGYTSDPTSGNKLVVNGNVYASGNVTVAGLAGTGTRMVVADGSGGLSTQSIPSGGGGGTLVSVSIDGANGFAQAYSTGTTNLTIGLRTTVSGILKGNGTGMSAATAGTDYEVPLTVSTGLTRSTNTISVNYGTSSTTSCVGNDSRLSDSRNANDVSSWAKAPSKPSYTWTDIGSKPTNLSSFTNDLGNYGGWITGFTETDPLSIHTSGGAMTGDLTVNGYGTNTFSNGTGDGLSYSTYNFKLSGWSSMAFYNPTGGGAFPNQESGLIDFRNGVLDMKGGFTSASGNIVIGGSMTASGGNSSNWNTAYGWGDWRHTTLAAYGITDAVNSSKVESGTYTPTLTNNTWITTSTADYVTYTRIGNIVHIKITGILYSHPNTISTLTLSIPVPASYSIRKIVGGGALSQYSSTNRVVGMVYLSSSTTVDFSFSTLGVPDPSGFDYSIEFDYSI